MPSSPCSILRRLLHHLAQSLGRLERSAVGYFTAVSPRRRRSRIAGLLLFGCMTVLGNNLDSCPLGCAILAGMAGTGKVPYVNAHLRTLFTGSDGSTTGIASFLGNFTALTQPSQTYFMLQRRANCSINLLEGTSTLAGSATLTANSPNYEQTLHLLASLKTTADVYPKGCAENSSGITSRSGLWVGYTQQNVAVFAAVASANTSNAVYLLTASSDFLALKFQAGPSLPYAVALATADLNGDGNGDLVVVNGFGTSNPTLSVLLGNADGTFQNPVSYSIVGSQYAVAVTIADVNNDGKLDLIAVSDDQHISVLTGKGDGTFNAATSLAAPALPGYTSSASTPILNLIAADLNADGKKDIVCSNGLVLLGNGDGSFNAVATPAFPFSLVNPSGYGPGLTAGDLNNDGKLDLVFNTGTAISTWMGKGDGTFTQGAAYASINNAGYVTVSDLDGDGNLDIYSGLANGGLYGGDESGFSSAYVLMGNGDGTFVGALQTIGTYNGANLGDVNGDGVPDLITNNANGSFTVQLGNGKGAFTPSSTFTAPASFVLDAGNTLTATNTTVAATYAVADINGDGKADLVFIESGLPDTYTSGTGFFRYNGGPIVFTAISNGDGTFQTPVGHAFPQIAPASGFDNTLAVSGLQIADVNKDGKNDLVLTYNETGGGTGTLPYNQGYVVLTGNGNGTFSATPALSSTYSSNSAPTTALVPTIVSTADLNNDGKADLIANVPSFSIGTGATTQLVAYAGNGDGTFAVGIPIPVTANAYGTPAVADFNKDGKLDIAFLAENAAGQAELVTALGVGNGTFATPTSFNLTGGDAIRSASLVAADFDGDTKADLALLDAHDYSGVFYGKGDGTFTSVPNGGYVVPKDFLNIAASGQAVAIDLNKDAKPDILAGNTILLNLYGAAPPITIPTSPLLTASASSIAAGASVTFTDLVTPASGTGVPTGTVTFYDGTTVLGTGAINASGVATYTTAGLAAGTRSITAAYPGDANFTASTSSPVSVAVSAAIGTATTLTASTSNAVSGTSITFTATVTPASGSTQPTGTVTFYDGTTAIGTGTLTSEVATFTTSALAIGSHSITASYGGAATFSASTSPVTPVGVTAPIVSTTTALAASSTNAVSGTGITFTATVTPASGTTAPTGSVTFFDGATTLGSGALTAGVATFTTSTLSVAIHSITASYGGAPTFSASTSSATSVTVTAIISTTTNLAASTASAVSGTSITFTATVTPASGTTAPTGTVTFKDGAVILGTGTLAAGALNTGIATYTTSALGIGGHSMIASYSGAGGFSSSSSTAVTVTINAVTQPGMTLTPTSGSLSLVAGATTGNTTTITVTPTGGFLGTVVLSAQVTTAPTAAINVPTVSFGSTSPVVINGPSAGTGTLTVTSLAPTTASLTLPGFRRIGGVALAGLLLLMLPARRRRVRMMFGLLLGFVVLAGGAIGCGGKGGGGSTPRTIPGTTTGNYVITVTATGGTSNAQTTVNLTVQ